MIRACCRLAVLAALIALAVGVIGAGGVAETIAVQNEAVRLIVNNTDNGQGRFAVDVVGGDPKRPEDDGQPLIYGRPIPWTSYTTILADGQMYAFGGATSRRSGKDLAIGELLAAPETREGAIVTSWRYGEIDVTQRLSIVEGPTTGQPDTARIAYTFFNRGKENHRVGLRMCLDTMLGTNDGAPFRLADRQILTDESLQGKQIQPYWQAFDSLSEPHVIAQGTLAGGELTPPDRVFFTNWGTLADSPWSPPLEPGRDFTRLGEFELDSAVALMWQEVNIAPGGMLTRVTYYGLGGLTIANGDLTLGVTAPATVTSGDGSTFMVLGYLENRGEGVARDAVMTLDLPASLQAVSPKQVQLGRLKPGEVRQVAWSLKATGAGTANIKVTATAFQLDPTTVQRAIRLFGPPRLTVTLPEPPPVSVQSGRYDPYPALLPAVITNTGGSTSSATRVELALGPGLNLAPGEDQLRWLGTLEPGKKVAVQWGAVGSGPIGSASYTVLATSNECKTVSTRGTFHWPDLPKRLEATITPVANHPGWHRLDLVLTNLPELAQLTLRVQVPDGIRLVAVERGGFLVSGGKVLTWASKPELSGGNILLRAIRPAPFELAEGSFASLWVAGSEVIPKVTVEVVQALDATGRPVPISVVNESKGGAK